MNLQVAIDIGGIDIKDVQDFYDRLCKKYKKLSVKAYVVHDDDESWKLAGRKLDYRGLYIEWPFRKIFLKANEYDTETVYHEIFHHLNPHLQDGPKFQKLLQKFIEQEYM